MQLLILTLFSTIYVVFSSGVQSLYTEKDHVLELDVNNFNSSVYHQPRAFFVEFYASWCGHCIHYKPTWVKFATQLRHWSKTVQVTVVNCADEKNSPLCREHAIAAFPTVKYFKLNSASKDDGQLYEGDKYNLPDMTRSVVSHVKADYDSNHPANWPKLDLSPESAILESLWAEAGVEAGLMALVIDNEPYGDGFATKINYQSAEQVYVAVISSKHALATQFGGVAVPSVQVFKRSQPNSPIYSSNEAFNFDKISTEIDRILEENGAQQKPPALNAAAAAASPTVSPVVDWKQFEVQYMDLVSSLHYMLTQEIPRREVIEKEHLKALKDFVHVMRKYVPLSAPVRRLLLRLDEYVQPITTRLLATEWLAKLKEIQEELGHPVPAKTDYKACRGSKPFLRGYTCGLWTLFHTITVEAYKQNKHDPNFKPGYDVLEPIHQFIYNYLSCVECAKNFDKMARGENGVLDQKNPEDVVLWLWNAHNRANKRLSGDASEDPMFKKQQFPNNALCLACHKPDGSFDQAEVLKFMVQYFSDIKVDGVRPEPGYKVSEFNNGKLEKVAQKHLNPKFAGMAGKVDRMEETERRLNEQLNELPQVASADRTTFYLVWMVIVALLAFAYVKYRQNRGKFWKTFYYHDYKLLPWSRNASSNLSKYVV
ncbi:unnamed protein product [Bursaphelenchus okinawaensis]|uniref:Sulfhydryl oxidase n=1 Tax=Bursaphelenchus okinawaensis TaxID=465554 RepID=A0A811LGM3_9BILA|nr:unnamed protein product [Bursaphelenchus okinawaensis]CAG9123473.1 unnamed protein product [Bursaphelenchus okinawaensis]